ncbi:MAG: uracil-DNA glycosylase [Candidatus Aenigmarchaeota archaeon]|nr:uracil-DNA glycosylase [Candidatus Aenigmarchaeota archaeon]
MDISWQELEREMRRCRKCDLRKSRTNYVIGDGDTHAKILFVGEAPGKNEDIQGKPFVGRSGKFLDELLLSVGLSRKDVYITNIIKCRPPSNRDPKPEEKQKCSAFLLKQLEIIKPKLIVSLGRHSMEYFFGLFGMRSQKIGDCHGKIFKIDCPVFTGNFMVLYHPAVAIYNSNRKAELLKDFSRLKEFK